MRHSPLLIFIVLVILASSPVCLGSEPSPPFSPTGPGVTLSFPSLVIENESAGLIAVLSQKLGLGNVQSSSISRVGQFYPIDGLSNSLPNRPDVLVRDVVEAVTTVGAKLDLYYADPGGASSRFVYATVWSFPLNASLRADPRKGLRSIATALGAAFDGTEATLQYTLGDQNHTTVYRPNAGKPIEFANQVQLIFYQGNNATASLCLYPWIRLIPPPSVSAGQAAATAVAYFNRTYGNVNFTLNRSILQYALDARSYSFAYSSRLSYFEKNVSPPGVLHGTVWVDAQTGQVLLADVDASEPSGPQTQPLFPWPLLVFAVAAASAALVAMGYIAGSDESARFGLILVLAFPFLLLQREKALDHFVRGQIYEYLRVHPGASFTDIRDDLSLKNGSAAYHLMVMGRMGFIISKHEGRLKHFFRADMPSQSVQVTVSALQYDILDALAGESLTQSKLAKRLSVSKQRVAYNVRALRRRGLLALVEKGGGLKATAAGAALLHPGADEDSRIARS